MYTATSPKTLVAAALALLGTAPHAAFAHMIMAEPPPFGGSGLDNSPLTGKDFPCKVKGDPKTFFKREKVTTVAVGEKHPLSFKGSAVHGGGSCQLAVTKDLEPTASSHWQVILSIHGGCPSTDGKGPSTYEWSIPEQVAPGDYVFQWSWISKMAGQPEFYQNCAALTVTGGKKKRHDGEDDGDDEYESADHHYSNETLVGAKLFARNDKLPDLWVGNMGPEINQCKSQTSTDPEYPDPGPNVIKPGKETMAFAKLTGSDCVPGNKQATGGSSPASGGGSSGGSSGGSDGSSGGSSGGSSSGGGNDGQYHGEGGSGGSGSGSGSGSSGSSSGSGSGSGFSGSGSSGSSSSAAAAAPSQPAAGATPSGFMTSVAASSASASAPAAAAPSSEAGSSSGSGSSGSGSAPAAPAAPSPASGSGGASGGENGACTEEGIYNCVGGSSYQRCASGKWTALEQMPGGTKCAEGKSNNLWARGEAAMMMRRRRV